MAAALAEAEAAQRRPAPPWRTGTRSRRLEEEHEAQQAASKKMKDKHSKR